MEDLWVFAYGSLMWRPGFEFKEQHISYAHGYRRALCIWSWVHRGTQNRPGLVLGLDRGGCCKGIAFRVDHKDRDQVIAYLRERELVTSVYLEKLVPVRLEDGTRVNALTYVADKKHEQYASELTPQAAADIVSNASGKAGPNCDYVTNTVRHLKQIGIRDGLLEHIDSALNCA